MYITYDIEYRKTNKKKKKKKLLQRQNIIQKQFRKVSIKKYTINDFYFFYFIKRST